MYDYSSNSYALLSWDNDWKKLLASHYLSDQICDDFVQFVLLFRKIGFSYVCVEAIMHTYFQSIQPGSYRCCSCCSVAPIISIFITDTAGYWLLRVSLANEIRIQIKQAWKSFSELWCRRENFKNKPKNFLVTLSGKRDTLKGITVIVLSAAQYWILNIQFSSCYKTLSDHHIKNFMT